MADRSHTNALAGESSPYLLQHAHNPVNWHPWSDEALRKAREEDKPILLSIGYSACHWCHVMERESFENEEIAALMNRNFVNIKVDREERPDLDSIYMTAVQMLTGGGGWPMTVFLTPDLIPFYAGTYFPPEDRHGMPGFPRVLLSVSRAFQEKRDAIRQDAAQVLEALRKSDRLSSARSELSTGILDSALTQLASSYDDRYGGFGQAPKFPPAMTLLFLLRAYVRTRKTRYREMADHTLEQMARGGIYDQLGGGFHRYSVDQFWLVPHFEKMLYDNALLSKAYLEAYQLSKKLQYRRVTEETLDYILREMTSPEGGFYSAQDADSEGEEGKYFVWTPAQVQTVLDSDEAELFCRYFGITEEGNFEGRNILHVSRPLAVFASNNNVDVDKLTDIIERGRRLLLSLRETRVKPGRDDKILTSWNALMMRSFAEAATALQRSDYREVAVRNAELLLGSVQDNGRLLHTYKDGRARYNGYLEDYSFLADSLISLYECTFDSRWLHESTRLARIIVEQFWDEATGTFFFTSSDHEELIYRPKDYYDNAVPSGNSAAARAFLRLAGLTGDTAWQDYAVRILKGMADVMSKHPSGFGNFLCALEFHLSSPKEIAIWGEPDTPATREMLREIFDGYLPNKVVACGVTEDVPLLAGRHAVDERPTAYVCRNFTCKSPVTAPEQLRAMLDEP